MTDYFEGCTTALERKTRYRELAKRHHPDIGGSLDAMKEVNRQYKENVSKTYTKFNASSDAFTAKMDRWKQRFDMRFNKYADAYYQFLSERQKVDSSQSIIDFMYDLMDGKFKDMDNNVLQLNLRGRGGFSRPGQKKL